ncbi:hypothetical protein DOTSEDRAFT_69305 [Dothistroma septosporum NZE10]|uniref:Uncharacterized protein n=1 Tax=Dothistroma septosporum (strain NZE10 / CBS 128990) TaxID=675120 RepID=N1PYL7_DOTSN|nr:hypothetical protein DOTSEDRAFT_69305 [Dothistroma septosporum NZE10]
MPGDGRASDAARLDNDSIDSSNNGEDDLSNEATAGARLQVETRLRQEAAQMRSSPSCTRSIRDVTSEFVAASQQLPPGELVKDDFFTLFEAVGALEIMDPKMDSGYIEEGDPFEPEFDVAAGHDLEEVLWIMDELLCLEMAFHQGYPLSQNVFTSLHVFRLLDPENKHPYHFARDGGLAANNAQLDSNEEALRHGFVHVVLEAYCIGLIKCVELALQAIQSQTYYEEEDFVTYLFGRELLPNLMPEESRIRLIDANNWIHEREKILGEDRTAALLSRIQSRLSMLLAMAAVESYSHIKISVMSYLGHDLARPTPDAFSQKVQRQLATSTPPRPQPSIAWSEACDLWAQLCDDLLAVEKVATSELRRNPQSLLRAVWAFGYRNPHPNTYARAKLQEILTINEAVAGDTPHHELLLTDIRDLVLPGCETTDPASFEVELPSDSRYRSSEIMNDFMNIVYGDWLNLYCIACQNRCRMRRCFAQALMSWSKLLEVAPEYDRKLNQIRSHGVIMGDDGKKKHFNPLTHWTRHHFQQLACWVIQLGFETDIYLPDECYTMYQLLRTTIVSAADGQMRPMASLTNKMLEDLALVDQRQTAGLVENAARQMIWLEQYTKSLRYIEAITLRQDIDYSLASALAWMFSLLKHMGVTAVPTRSIVEAQMRQEARLKPFMNMTAKEKAKVFRADFMLQASRCSSGISIDEKYIVRMCAVIETNKKIILEGIARLARLATDAMAAGTERQWAEELQLLKRTAFDMGINAQRILQICQAHGSIDFDKDKEYSEFIKMTISPAEQRQHTWWVVPQISEKKR